MHRSYTAAYMVLGIAIAFVLYIKSRSMLWWVYIVLFSLITLLSGSKAGILSGVILCFLILSSSFIFYKRLLRRNLVLIISILAVGCIAFFYSNASRRFDYVSKAVAQIQWANNPTTESTGARLLMWNAALEVWGDHLLLGVGTGDVVDELYASNLDKNNTGVSSSKLNAHNQFLNFAVQFGVIGIGIISLIFLFLFNSLFKKLDRILLYMVLIFFVNFLFESFLETRSGIVPFSLLICSYLVVKNRSEEN
jgi:O-antigen ligase